MLRYDLHLNPIPEGHDIPGSFWGDEEAGVINNQLYYRTDTPIHSVLHEACHYICMDQQRREKLNTDAAGDYDEENAVCYLQIILAGCLVDYSYEKMFKDMDEWGYSFRLGSARRWFHEDAQDAENWLITHRLIDENLQPLWRCRI